MLNQQLKSKIAQKVKELYKYKQTITLNLLEDITSFVIDQVAEANHKATRLEFEILWQNNLEDSEIDISQKEYFWQWFLKGNQIKF
jgi:hypothetical protein